MHLTVSREFNHHKMQSVSTMTILLTYESQFQVMKINNWKYMDVKINQRKHFSSDTHVGWKAYDLIPRYTCRSWYTATGAGSTNSFMSIIVFLGVVMDTCYKRRGLTPTWVVLLYWSIIMCSLTVKYRVFCVHLLYKYITSWKF